MNRYEPKKKLMNFVRAGETVKILQKKIMSLLRSTPPTPDMQMIVGIGSQLRFPVKILQTNLHPDMIIYLEKTMKSIMLE